MSSAQVNRNIINIITPFGTSCARGTLKWARTSWTNGGIGNLRPPINCSSKMHRHLLSPVNPTTGEFVHAEWIWHKHQSQSKKKERESAEPSNAKMAQIEQKDKPENSDAKIPIFYLLRSTKHPKNATNPSKRISDHQRPIGSKRKSKETECTRQSFLKRLIEEILPIPLTFQ